MENLKKKNLFPHASECVWVLNFFGKEKKFGEILKKKEKSFVTNIIIIKKKVHKSARRRRAFFLQMYMLSKAV